MGDYQIHNVADGTDSLDAINKGQLDAATAAAIDPTPVIRRWMALLAGV